VALVRPGLLLGVSVIWLPLAFLFDGLTTLVLPIRLGGDAATLGFVSLVGLGVGALLQPVAGWLSDRSSRSLDRRAFMVVAAMPAILGLWFLGGTAGFAAALAGYLLVQASAGAIQAAGQALVPEFVHPDRQGSAAGVKTAFDIGGAFVAFLVLGALLAGPGVPTAATVIGLVLVAALALLGILVPGQQVGAPPGPQDSALPAATARTARTTWTSQTTRTTGGTGLDLPRGLGSLIASRFLFLLGTYGVGRFLLLLVAERLGLDPEQAVDEAAGLLALFSLATALGALSLGRLADTWSRSGLTAAGAALGAAGIALLAIPAGLPGLLAGGLLLAFGNAAFLTANWAAVTSLAPPADAGRLLGFVSLGTGLAAAGAGLLGFVVAAGGFGPALLLGAMVTAAAAFPGASVRTALRPAREPVP
jgi:MFS family permease